MMERKRNKAWRRHHARRVFKARLTILASYQSKFWFEILDQKWTWAYKTSGKPCSCWICRKARYNRREADKEARRAIYSGLNEE